MLSHFRTSAKSVASTSTMAPASMSSPATLLFAHATGFCKEIWSPIVRRVQASLLLRQHAGDVQCIAFDFPYHGSLRDESVTPELHLEDPAAPRVTHTMNQWVQVSSDALYAQVKQLRAAEASATHKTPIIGIGHSMGAVALWNTEVNHPGTFDGLVLFEPVYRLHVGPTAPSTRFLLNLSLQREYQWCVCMCECMSACLRLSVRVCTCVCVRACVYVRVCTYVCVRTCACVHVCVCVSCNGFD